MKKKTAIIIPARYDSTRLKGKLLIEVKGKPVIQWVYEIAKQSKEADEIIIATDNEKIYEAAKGFNANVEMTSKEHKCGSDRIREVAKRHEDFEYILNLQGDEPTITAPVIDLAIKNIKNGNCDISTLVREIDKNQANNPNCVKCVFDKNNYALYFSRSIIPFERNENCAKHYGHIGLYGYTRTSLMNLADYNQADIEKAESLEQLRALYNGLKIKVAIVDINPIGIDTIEDLEKFKEFKIKN